MKHVVAALALLFMAAQVQASWSAFAQVTPASENRYDIGVSVTPVDGSKSRFIVKIDNISFAQHAWLVITSKEQPDEQQELRNHIWASDLSEENIMILAKLNPNGEEVSSATADARRSYEIVADTELIKHAYFYIDYPTAVFDGGYYYSVDINAFIEHYESETRVAQLH